MEAILVKLKRVESINRRGPLLKDETQIINEYEKGRVWPRNIL